MRGAAAVDSQPAACGSARRAAGAGEDPANDDRCRSVKVWSRFQRVTQARPCSLNFNFVAAVVVSFLALLHRSFVQGKMSGHVAWLNKPSEAWKQRTVRLSACTLTTRLSLSLTCTATAKPPDA